MKKWSDEDNEDSSLDRFAFVVYVLMFLYMCIYIYLSNIYVLL